ncbi:SusC/RagA family TonB-linked outer membrane protein [Sphingobacterium sp. 2149]|uniref:SusC/RagA family TonB-linked outer membrane protein n=1 Tax=Sphingobacterium sp. 2149 TaxID=2817763 RepID=UPI00285F771A|nr:SusC/RagA family TonB-linked outer membrane protein [Sphingobacterium sp. 2149]MDR6733506.1 TonB-linked SusC/RagA family outer membrane protein [Sphingobacterium sp. 2149]
MKLIVLFLTTFILQASAGVLAQKITLKEKNAPLGEVFNKISAQTGYDFLYSTSLLRNAKPVSIEVRQMELKEVLKRLFSDQPLDFIMGEKSVVVRPAIRSVSRPPAVLGEAKIDISGRVVNAETGEPLDGATVLVKGRMQGDNTASDGTFQIRGVDENATLVIAFVGYSSQEIAAKKDLGTIRLEPLVSNLGEVSVSVNTGYQVIKPEQSTGAVAQINTKAYESRISTNFLDGLVNRIPGLMINNNVSFTSTTPGSTQSSSRSLFNIRGISTMSANQNPLIVVDGYPTELTLDMIDPNDIKNVTVLKDAAAATVYGVRASNGVIVIERKQAAAGKPKFNFRTTLSLTPRENYKRYRYDDNASAIFADFQRFQYGNTINADIWPLLSTIGSGEETARSPIFYLLAQSSAKVITSDQFDRAYGELQAYDNKEEYRDIFLRMAATQTYNLQASGGNENALYIINTNYTGNRLSHLNNDDNRWSISARSRLKLSSKLSLELIMDYQEMRFRNAPVPDLTSLYPFERLRDVNGKPAYSTALSSLNPFYNDAIMRRGLDDVMSYPLVDVNEINDRTKTANNHITANFVYSLGNGIKLAFGGIYENSNTDFRHYASEFSSEARKYINNYVTTNPDGTLKYNIPKGGYLQQQHNNFSSYTARASININKKIGEDHSINGIVGGELRNVINKGSLASYFGYNDETLLQQPVDYAGITNGSIRGTFINNSPFANRYDLLFDQQYAEDRFVSAFTNLLYSYKDRYSISASARIDQSNLFGTDPKYKYKPLWSVGGAWNIEKENFMADVAWVNHLKLRASYGFNGNVAKLSLPQVIAQYTLNQYTSPSSSALSKLSYANGSLRWEQTKNLNAGLSYRIFKRVSGTIDYYKKNSTDLLGNSMIDPTIGTSPSIINNASIRNQGLEIGLHADWLSTRNFNWNTGFILGRNTSKVLDVYQRGPYNPQTLNLLGYVKGFPVGAMFTYQDAGLDNTGYPLVRNDRGTLYDTHPTPSGSAADLVFSSDTSGLTRYAGSSIPTINAGLSNRVDIGPFYIYAMINYYGGFKVRVPAPNPSVYRPISGSGEYWKNSGDELITQIPALETFGGRSYNALYAYNFSDRRVVHGDYITLGDLTLSYSFDDKRFVKKLGFSHFEVKLQGSNLWTVGFNRYNFSSAAGNFLKTYVTPTYTLALFTTF